MTYALTWMPDVIRAAGLRVQEAPGWQARGHGDMGTVLGVLGHHTGGLATGNYPSLAVVRDGRADLPGPLCNLGLGRDATVFVVAAGCAWHAGAGSLPWCPKDAGNQHLIGIEAESTGGGDWTAAQLDGYPRLVAAVLAHQRLGADRYAGHLEYAPTRKVDPAHWPGGMNGFRATVAARLAHQGDDMALDPTERAWLEDVLRRVQSIHLHGFGPLPDVAKTPPPPWQAGGDLTRFGQWLAEQNAAHATPVQLSDAQLAAMAGQVAEVVRGDVDQLRADLAPLLALVRKAVA